jgi:G:T-mismatch repair DNA endonuclease (very short patch repair protein)
VPSAVPKLGESLADLFPDVAAQWHPTRNGDLTPADVKTGSDKQVWWKCPAADDHEWLVSVKTRTKKGNGCPCCAGYRLSVTNRLDTQFPEMAAQWHPTRNGDLTPAGVVAGSHKRFWWKCPVAGDHEWQAKVGDRTRQEQGCPCCAGLRLSVTNRLDTQFPEIAAEWHPTRNGDLTPADVVAASGKRVWWKCPVADDHEWRAQIEPRTSRGLGCGCCAGRQLSVTNRLDTQFPEIAAEWHPTRNGDLTPADVVAGAGKRVWWKCPVADDHEWRASLDNRTRVKSGCPSCTLTPRSAQEMRLAHELAALINFDVANHKIRFVGRIRDVDIVLDDLKVIVEFDGSYWHRNKSDKDCNKTVLLEEAGWQVIRVRERPLESIHVNDVMVDTLAPAKTAADLVLKKIVKVTGTEIPRLDEYLASNEPWRETEALAAIRAYQVERAAKKAANKVNP